MVGNRWVQDIQGATSVAALSDFLLLWDLLSEIVLQSKVEDEHCWHFSASGLYSATSAYESFFLGVFLFELWEHIWKSWVPRKCKFFLWLVMHNRCWIADRLSRHGMSHPTHYPLCDQGDETIQHILTSCVFSRQFWFSLFDRFGLPDLSLHLDENRFNEW